MEKQPRTANVAKLVAPWLLEGVFIVISVLLGFAAARYGEERADRALAHRALASLQSELEYNLTVVEPFVAFHRSHFGALSKVPVADGGDSGFQVFLRARPELPKNAQADAPLVRSAAWDAAVSSGALRLLDYDLIARLSEIYQMQDHLGEAVGRIPTPLPAFFDPRERAPSVQLALAALNENRVGGGVTGRVVSEAPTCGTGGGPPMIFGVLEYGEVRIFDGIDHVMREWALCPSDVESGVIVFYDADGVWLDPLMTGESFLLQRNATPGTAVDSIGLALLEAMTLVPNPHFLALDDLRARFPFSS